VSSPVATPSALERGHLADALAAAGPDAPTLCEGWTTRDLAAHLVARERRPDSAPGLVVRRLAGWTDHVRAGYAARPYDELVDLVRTGPPLTSPFRLPGVDRVANLTEHFVHTEDVLRAAPDADGATPRRRLDPAVDEALWAVVRQRGRAMLGRAGVAVVFATPDGRQHRAGSGPTVRLTGEPGELVLLAFGRGASADVRRDGDDAALAALAAADLRV
jgi:uncharacterized protein (TIGR03085 family)